MALEAQKSRSFDRLADSAFVADAELADLFGVMPNTIWRWAKQGLLPAPRRFSTRCTRWNVGEVRNHLALAAQLREFHDTKAGKS
jgi:predicted DNA-binding transcriptional regulator AlpA